MATGVIVAEGTFTGEVTGIGQGLAVHTPAAPGYIPIAVMHGTEEAGAGKGQSP